MSAPVNVGEVLAEKYLVERVLGAGGMGVVVAARHLQLDERVAIKFLLPQSLANPGLVQRFLREGRLAAKIRSDHVARVRDVGTLETGAPYLVLEYLDGIDLDALLTQRGPLPIETAIDYILQVCEALGEAHSMGIVHRDLKPANLFLTTRPDGSPCVKLIDFGISKLTEAARDAAGEMLLTTTAEVRGSPLFMSPEQLKASPTIDARSDIWALGVTLHNLLTGDQPFPAKTIAELCAKILQGSPLGLRVARPEAPEALEAALLCCFHKDPADRYANVAELAAALAPFGSSLSRSSVERISKIMSIPVPTVRITVDPPPPATMVDMKAGALSYATTEEVRAPVVSTAATGDERRSEAVVTGNAAWSISGTMKARSRRLLLAVLAAALLLGGIFAFIAVLRPTTTSTHLTGDLASAEPGARPSSAVQVTATATSSEPADPAPSTAPVSLGQPPTARAPSNTSAPPSTAVSSTSSAIAPPSRPTSPAPSALTPPPPVAPPPPSVAPSKPSSPRDLFNTNL